MEKGALFCWKASRGPEDNDAPGEDENGDKDVEWDSASQGAPMSVQQAYAEMIGREALTLDRYQVCEPSYYLILIFVLHLARIKNISTIFEPVLPPSWKIKPNKRLSLTFAAWVTS